MDDPPARRHSRVRIAVAVASGVAVLGAAGLWTQRTGIASRTIDAELTKRGVAASYDITRLALGGQRLENVRIGDPSDPDLTADYADLRMALGTEGPYLASVSAGGVRLRGRLVDGKVTFGAIDRLLPAPTGAPFSLPDLAVALRDASLRLETAGGTVGLAVEGSGKLSDGFTGRLAVVAPQLAAGGCRIRDARATVNIAIVARRPALDGPVRAGGVACGAFMLARPAATIDLALGAALDRWSGGAFLTLPEVRNGATRLRSVAGRIGYAGTATATAGTVTLAAGGIETSGLRAGATGFDGRYRIGAGVRAQGALTLAGAAVDPAIRAQVLAAARSGGGTPAAPVIRAIGTAADAALARFAVRADVDFAQGGGASKLRLSQVTATAASGARLVAREGAGLGLDLPGGATRIDGHVTIAGGGLPTIDAVLRQPAADAPVSGRMRVADYVAGGAVLRMTPVRFRAAPGESRFDTVLTMDGPVASGQVTGLRLPVAGQLGRRGSFVVNRGCVPLAFERLALSGLAVGRTATRLCPRGIGLLSRGVTGGVRGGGRIATPLLTGTLGGSPVRIAAQTLAFDLAGPDFVADRLAVALGRSDARTMQLAIDRFAGNFVTGGVGGRFAGLSGQILAVPILMTEGAGAWQLIGGALRVAGDTLTVSDAAADPRFKPLISKNVMLTLKDNVIVAGGHLEAPATGAGVTDVTIRHDLTRAAGTARLAVPGITFGPALQPEQLTRLTLGVVANVKGTVRGEGMIAWNGRDVTSRGTFGTEAMDLAAAFGPVTGLKTQVTFDDLLALRTTPGQVATVAEINPGIAVRDGVVRYRLLPEQRVAVEGGRWPFSGGTLTLEPTLLDFSGTKERRMTFRITGMDAAEFVQQFDFKNIAVTGIFDGVMPMIFDDHGGRIVDGRLAVRPGGGTLSYVGEISNAKLGRFGALAFDALKRMRYRDLTIVLDGALDGELVSKVVFDGTNQTPKEAIRRNSLLAPFANLPFRFNIVIRAPFRGLLNSAQSLNDPRGLIRQALPVAETLPGGAPVQVQESEPVR